MDTAELVSRLHQRYRRDLPDAQRADMDSLVREEALIALSELLQFGLNHDDLKSDEVELGLQLARAGRFRGISAHLAAELTHYQRVHAA